MKDNFYFSFHDIKRKMVQKKWLEGESLDSDENVAENTPFRKAGFSPVLLNKG
jgi:hypothetical protein